ncbi:tegument protein UL16 [Leporid alphaherpesvirus 4]|uniref:Tegument protein UL16 n=1 Tax=Leporid alphaherpesvirus 4 TaxID=481315 RepID=J9QQS1_9ALPH|nr:tegument protein UL16 [Leporid alphaherpesvirus 4]AFR32456.1 tegument protein UL16 [Leporid alphaherpesvirus 4]
MTPAPSAKPHKSSDVDLCDTTASAAINSLFVWRLVRADDRIKVFRCLMTMTELLGRTMPPLDDPSRSLFCETFVYITRPRAMRLAPGVSYAIFIFNRERRYCAATEVRAISNPDAPQLFSLTFRGVTRASAPDEVPDPSAETLPEEPAMLDVIAGHSEPAPAPPDPTACLALGPGAWWHFPSRRIYRWVLDDGLLPLCPPGWRACTLGRIIARITNHEAPCPDCDPEPHVDSVNALWSGCGIGDACPCISPCASHKTGRRHIQVRGDVSLCVLLFPVPVTAIFLPGSARQPRISDRLRDVVGGSRNHESVVPLEDGWRLRALSPYASAAFATSCPAISRVVYGTALP